MLNWSRNNNEAVAPAELDGNEDAPKKGVYKENSKKLRRLTN